MVCRDERIELTGPCFWLYSRYKFELDPNHEVKKRMGVVMRTENGIMLKPTRR